MSLCAKDLMTPQVIVTQEDASVSDFITLLKEHGISGAPVVDPQAHLVGVVSVTDVLLHSRLFEGEFAMDSDYHARVGEELEVLHDGFDPDEVRRITVGDIMSPESITATADTPVRELASVFCTGSVRRILIVEGKRLLGIVSITDILRAVEDGRLK